MRKLPLNETEFREIYSRVPKLCVEAVIVHQKKVLMVKRKGPGWEGMWYLPGVTVYYRERLVEAVKRLGREELGVELEVGRLLGYVEFMSEEQERGFGYSVTLQFEGKTEDKIPKRSVEDEEVKLFGDLPENMVEEHKEVLEGYWKS